MRKAAAILVSDRILAACVSAIQAFVNFYRMYQISVPATFLQEQTSCLMTILLLTCDVQFLNTSASNVDGHNIINILLGLLAVDPAIDYKSCPLLRNVAGQCTSRKGPEKNCRSRWFLFLYILTASDTRRICCTCSVAILFRTRSGLFAKHPLLRGPGRVSAFPFTI